MALIVMQLLRTLRIYVSILFLLKSAVQHKPVPLDLAQKVPSMTDSIDCAIEAPLAEA